jgi:Holliday junction resolvase RusA-like endonuclease
MTDVYYITILGAVKSKKNSKRIINTCRVPLLISSRSYLAWEAAALPQVRKQWEGRPPIDGDVRVVARIYQGPRQSIDLTNAVEGTWDVLEKAGVLKNDYQIVAAQLTRSRDNANPRIELELMPYQEKKGARK